MGGDNITTLEWASVDAVTLGNAHIRTAYHWLKDTIREREIDVRDIPSVLNLAHFLTNVVMGPAMRSSPDMAPGYTKATTNSTCSEALITPIARYAYATVTVFHDLSVGGYVAKT